MILQDDTISAIATPIGEAGIGIIRMSGEQSFNIADNIFQAMNKQKISDIKRKQIIFRK